MPLNLAFYNGSFKTVQILLEAGADPNTQDFHVNTPLHEIAFCKTLSKSRLYYYNMEPKSTVLIANRHGLLRSL